MGAASSVGATVDRAEAERIAGDRFDAAAFDALAGHAGSISREAFLSQVACVRVRRP